MLLATALALLITGCAQQTFTVQNKPAAVAPKAHHPSFLRFWNWAKKTVDAAKKVVCSAENVVKQKPSKRFVNGLLGFITPNIALRWKRVCIAHNNCMSCPSIWATLSALLINILLSSFQLFLHSDQPLSEGEIIPFSGVCQSGGGCVIHAGGRGSFTHWLTNCFDVQPTTTSGNIITRRASFSAASANSFVYFASSAATSRWRICMSVIAAFASFSSLAFLSRWALWVMALSHGND